MKSTSYSRILLWKNNLDQKGFCSWVFEPGMKYNDLERWWNDHGHRKKPHEGIDFAIFEDHHGKRIHIDENFKVPSLFDGRVIKIFDDFLGKSILLLHENREKDDRRLCTIYGHTLPRKGLAEGTLVNAGEIIATLSIGRKPRLHIPIHLHLSTGWANPMVPYSEINWLNMRDPARMILIDPLPFIMPVHKAESDIGW